MLNIYQKYRLHEESAQQELVQQTRSAWAGAAQ